MAFYVANIDGTSSSSSSSASSTTINSFNTFFKNTTISSSSSASNLLNFTLNAAVDEAEMGEEEEQYGANMMNRPLVKTFFLMAYILVFISCVVGNSMVLICIVANRSMRTVTNFFLANLAIADLLVGVFCVCQNAAHFVLFAHGTWPFGRVLCHAYIYILHFIPNSSAGILVLLSVERFIAVLRPMLVHHLMTRSVLILCTLLVWTLSALMNIPYLIAVQYMEFYNPEANQYYGICTRRHLLVNDINLLQLVSTINLITWYVLPLTLLFSIYASIGLVLIKTTDDDSVARTSQVHHQQQQQRGSPTPNSHQMNDVNVMLMNGNNGIKQKYSLLNGAGNQQQQQGAISHTTSMTTTTTITPAQKELQQQQQQHKFSAPAMCNPNRKVSQPISQIRRLSTQLLNRTSSNCADFRNGAAGLQPTAGQIRKLPKIELVDSRRRVIRLCAVIVLAFAILSLPRYIYLTWSVWREANAPRCLNCLSALVQPTTFLLMFLASGINPILYAFLSQRFRTAIRDTFSFRKGREQRKEQMMLLLRNHRMSEQMERDAFGGPIMRTLSSNGSSQNGAAGISAYRLKHQQQRRGSHQAILENGGAGNQQQQKPHREQTPRMVRTSPDQRSAAEHKKQLLLMTPEAVMKMRPPALKSLITDNEEQQKGEISCAF